MKIFVFCDDQKNIKNIAIPNPDMANQLSAEMDDGGQVIELDVDESEIDSDALLTPESEEAQNKVYDMLRKMI